MTYPNTDYKKVGLSPRWVIAILSAPTTVYMTGATKESSFNVIAGDSSGFTVTGSIKSTSELIQECNWFSGLQATSGFAVELNDIGGEYSTLIEAAPQTFMGKEVVVYLYFAETTPTTLDSTYEVWRGYVDDFSFNDMSIKIDCVDASLRKIESKKMPGNNRLIEDADYVPERTVGKVFPMIYGEVDRSPILMSRDKRDSVIHVGVVTGYTASTKILDVTWISSPFPTIASLANTYLKVVYGNDKSSDFTGEANDDSLVGIIKKITHNSAPDAQGIGTVTLDSGFTHAPREWGSSEQGVVIEILDAELEYSAWKKLSTDNFDHEGFQAESGADYPVFTNDSDTSKFLQLDPTQYSKEADFYGGHYTHLIDFDVSYLIGRDQLNLIVAYAELSEIFKTNGYHQIEQYDAGNYIGHEYAPEGNTVDDDKDTYASIDTTQITNSVNWNTQYKEIHWDLMFLYKYLQQNNREQINFSKVFLTIKYDYDYRAVSGQCTWYIELRSESYDMSASEGSNTPPQSEHILKKKTIQKVTLNTGVTETGTINGIPEFIDPTGDNDTYRDIRVELENVSDAAGLINKHAAFIVMGGGDPNSQSHRELIDIYSVGIVFERQIALADAKEFYANIKGRHDFDSNALISVGSYQEHPFFCMAHALIAENGFAATDFNLDTSDSVKFGFTLIEQLETLQFLEAIAGQTCSKILIDKAGIWSNTKYDGGKSFKISGTATPDNLDIFDQTGAWNTGTGLFTKPPLIGISDIKLTPVDDCYSNFVVKYNYNYATGDYDNILYIYSDGTTNLLDADLESHSVATLQSMIASSPAESEATFEIELDMIRDRVSAGIILERYFERLYKRWWTFTINTFWVAFEHEIGDVINVQHTMINKLFSASYTTKKWEIMEKRIMASGGVDLTVVEI